MNYEHKNRGDREYGSTYGSKSRRAMLPWVLRVHTQLAVETPEPFGAGRRREPPLRAGRLVTWYLLAYGAMDNDSA